MGPARSPVEAPASPPEEDAFTLEQWALADPLADALDLSDADLEELESDEFLDSELDDYFSNPNPGESL